MSKILIIALMISFLPSGASAAEENPMESKTLLQKISSLQVFKLRLPYSLQRSIEATRQQELAASPDSCEAKSSPHQRGGNVEISCDTHKAMKKELSAVAAN